MMTKEIWKPIKGYEGLYEVSNTGKVKSLGGKRTKKTTSIRKPYKKENGYLHLMLSKDGVTKGFYVHRLVATMFIPNPYNLSEVNHKDENKENNTVENLEWCDHKYNMQYGNIKTKMSVAKINHPRYSKQVIQFDLQGNRISEYPSVMEASRKTGFKHQNIQACCTNIYKTSNGFIWKYK